MSRLSEDLYQYLCTVPGLGTIQSVKQRRMIHEVEDELFNKHFVFGKILKLITSGSRGEGFNFMETDIDRLYVFKGVNVFQKIEDANKNIVDMNNSICLESIESIAGYVKLKVHRCDLFRDMCVEKVGGLYLSSSKMTKSFQKYLKKISLLQKTLKGPSLSAPNELTDDVFALHCNEWIKQAHSWLIRPRQMWPSPTIIANIIEHGVLVVPVGSKGSPNKDIEWRISFNVAEKQLIYTFNHTQFLCYGLLKILLQVIKRRFDIRKKICSYYLKTVIFWIAEETKQDFWKPRNLWNAYMACLKRLTFYVQHSELPHYFISNHNLFQNKINNSGDVKLLEILHFCLSNGLRFLLSSEIFSRFGVISYNPRSYGITFGTLSHFRSIMSHENNDEPFDNSACYITKAIQKCTCRQKQRIYLHILSGILKTRALIFYPTTAECNKGSYIKYRRFLSYLLMGTYEDSVSGWLVTAMVFYNMQLYSLSLYILNYVQSKHFSAAKIEHSDLLHVKTIMLIVCHIKSPLIPTELLDYQEVLSGRFLFPCFIFPPIELLYFLKFLCHFRMCSFDDCMATISAIWNLSDGKLHPNLFTPFTNKILEISYDMIGIPHEQQRYY